MNRPITRDEIQWVWCASDIRECAPTKRVCRKIPRKNANGSDTGDMPEAGSQRYAAPTSRNWEGHWKEGGGLYINLGEAESPCERETGCKSRLDRFAVRATGLYDKCASVWDLIRLNAMTSDGRECRRPPEFLIIPWDFEGGFLPSPPSVEVPEPESRLQFSKDWWSWREQLS